MKILLTTLNAKFVHSSLALRYLKNYCREDFPDIQLKEYTINDSLDYITSEIYQEKAKLVAFSCYIWNMTQTLQVIENLKKVAPETIIVLGGPEVSYDPEEIMKTNASIDYIISGEGEEAFRKLLKYLDSKESEISPCVPGLTYRDMSMNIKSNDGELIKDLGAISSPYENKEDLVGLENKIIYYESSRGCPFNCQYCLSSTIHGVRFFPLEKVKRDLKRLISIGVKQVKFVDRTFNCNKKHSLELMKFLKEEGVGVNFHFEIAADILDEEIINFLKTVSPGQFQFEIGIQSTNHKSIIAIQRKMDLAKVYENIKQLREENNIHLHLDLIAGLPYEDILSFKNSFDDVFKLKPHQLQLGFLKLLKGSGIRKSTHEYEYTFQEHPPYQVLSNKWISYSELIKLHHIEELVEKYYNSGFFVHTIEFIVKRVWASPFELFEDFSRYWNEEGLIRLSHSLQGLYNIFAEYYKKRNLPQLDIFLDVLKFDLLLRSRVLNLPSWAKEIEGNDLKEKIWDFLKNEENIQELMLQYKGKKPKDIIKTIHYASFEIDIKKLINSNYEIIENNSIKVIFDYSIKNKISGFCLYYIL